MICFFYHFLVCFKVFDNDQDGFLSNDEISKMVDVMLFICEDNIATQNKAATDKSGMVNYNFINDCNLFYFVIISVLLIC